MSALRFLRQQFASIPALPEGDLAGQTVVVTGANAGLGYEMSKMLAARRPGKLILTTRSMHKMEGPLREIRATYPDLDVVAWELDLFSNASIRAFADRASKESGARLDLLILNAGVQVYDFELHEGHELTMKTNVWSTLLLYFLLHPLMKRTTSIRGRLGPSRAIFVGSDVHQFISKVPLDGLLSLTDDAKHWTGPYADARLAVLGVNERYPLSKMVLMSAYLELAKHTKADEVIVTMSEPGLCSTTFTKAATSLKARIARTIGFALIARTPETGARCILCPALLDDGLSTHGQYFCSCQVALPSDYVCSEEGKRVAASIWTDLMASLERVDARIADCVR